MINDSFNQQMLYKITDLATLEKVTQISGITEIYMCGLRDNLISSCRYKTRFPKQLYKYVSYINETSVRNDQICEIAKVTIHSILINIQSRKWGDSVTNSNIYITTTQEIEFDLHCDLLQLYPKYLIPLETFQSLPNSPEIQSLFPALDNAERYYFDKSRLQTHSADPDLIFHYSS